MNFQNGYNYNNQNNITNPTGNYSQNGLQGFNNNYNNIYQNQMPNSQMNMYQAQNQMPNSQMNMYPAQNQMPNSQMNYSNMYPTQLVNNQMNYNNMYQNNNAYQNLSLMNMNSANNLNKINYNQNNELNMVNAKSSNYIGNRKITIESMETNNANNVNNSNISQPNTQSNQNNIATEQQTQNVEEKDTKKNDKKDEKDIKIDTKKDNEKDKAKNDKEKKNKAQAEPKSFIPKSQTNAIKPKIKLDFMVKSRGLVNVGATCYMNSTLQCFYHIKDLSEAIINDNDINESLEFTNCYKNLIEELAGCKDRYKFNSNQRKFEITNEEINSIKPTEFKDILSAKNPLFKGVRAGDAKDLIMFLLQEMDKEITLHKNKTKEIPIFKGEKISEMEKENFKKIHNSPFGALFYGFQKTTNICVECKKKDEGYNILNILPLPLEKIFNSLNQKNLQDINMMGNNQIKPSDITKNMTRKLKLVTCFRENQKEELLNGSNQMYCNQCKKSCDMKQKMEIYRAPKVFILILDRGRDNAFECDVNIPFKLDISEYVIDKENSPKKFDLKGIISHFGESSIEGHFTAFCKHFDDTWRQYNDAIVRNINDEDIFQGTPYILFYQQDIEAK